MIWVTIQDIRAMEVVEEWQPLIPQPTLYDAAFLIVITVCAASLIRRSPERNLGVVLVFLVLVYEAFSHRRNQAILDFAAVVLTAPAVADMFRAMIGWVPTFATPRAAKTGHAITATAAVVCLAICASDVRDHRAEFAAHGPSIEGLAHYSFETDVFPIPACQFIRAEQFPPNVHFYNDFEIGGFMAMACGQKVFVDSRIDVFAGPALDHVVSISDSQGRLSDLKPEDKDFLRSQDIDAVLTVSPLTAKFFAAEPGWTLVYVDQIAPITESNAWVFVRNRPKYDDLIARCRRDWASQNGGQEPSMGN
jgi:hypothetical protein